MTARTTDESILRWRQLSLDSIYRFWTIYLLLMQLSSGVWTIESCSELGAAQLKGGANEYEGRLEVCAQHGSGLYWGTVCNDPGAEDTVKFDINAAKVVCRQLGIQENALSDVITNIFFGGGESLQPIHLDNLLCTGAETSLLNCNHSGIGEHDCKHDQDIGIICKRSQDCNDTSVRLVDGNNYNATAGRVEYCVGGRWGTVCNFLWGDPDAQVVCRQLGLNSNDPKALSQSEVPTTTTAHTPIVLDGVNCQGNEVSLSDCEHLDIVEECTPETYVGAFCTNIIECNDSDVRILPVNDDQKENEGRVEFCSSGRWGLVCHNDWDNNDATVVCRQLGYNVEVGSALATESSLGQDPPPTHLNRVNCIGTESSLSLCPVDNRECLFPGAGVVCPVLNGSDCSDRDVRLQGGDLSDEIGQVEVCVSGQWNLVCDDNWDDIDASVVCRQLGYTDGVATNKSVFGRTVGVNFALDEVNCTGNESNIFDCQYPLRAECGGVSDQGAGVICGVTPGPREKCSEVHTNKSISIVGSNRTNLTAGSIGTCHRYLGQTNLCNNFFKSSDYVFTKINQSFISNELDARIEPVLSGECGDLISRVLCHYFFAPCGANGLLHLPLSVCSEECRYVESTCADKWNIINTLLSNTDLKSVNCNSTDILLQGLNPCCIDAGIEIKSVSPEPPAVSDEAKKSNSTPLVVGIVVPGFIVLLGLVIIAICLATVVVKKRKAAVRSLKLEVLTSPSRSSIEPLTTAGFKKDYDEIEFGGDVKLRSNGSRRLHEAVPNPYSNKQELGVTAALLAPTDNKMMNRISSSIIRELSSNMLIPYTRLKLMECVGQGEFGVVYKAQYTEPEGDIGYKTSTVAVKTLKGFFDNSQVNKIMEESIKMKHFDHPNVLHLMGVCLDAGPAPYVVMPYMANGSLLHYLKKERNNIVLQVGGDDDVKLDVRKRLTVMCLQIASGMEYLAGERFVHRDLAARNCMIDIHFVIKIADFGLSEDIYSKNYFRQSGSDKSVKLPVKWMAPESLSDGVFSEKTDVWSFGVTCWEIFSGGKTPYPGADPLLLSQMLDTEQRLNKPVNAACPDEMYTLMMKCWAKQPDGRPSFSDIVISISKYTEVIAGCLDINFNPFKSTDNKMMNRISSSIIRELSSNMLIPYTRLKLMECVGQGEFGVVYKAQYTEQEGDIGYKTSTVAVKTLKGYFDNSQINKIMEESIKMKHFDHPNVLHLIGVCLDAGPAPYVVMPYMANGSLLHYLKKERNNIVLQVGGDDDVKLDVRKRLTVMCLQIASGMEYLAGERFVHRDLAARNCMIDIHFVIKIADFGLSEDIYSKNYFRQSGSDKSVKLPVKWMAPESLSDGVFSEKTDVWSFGVTCWEIFSGGKTPYPGADPLLLSQTLDAGQRLNKPVNAACPDELYTLMVSCWNKEPDNRPGFADIVTKISNYTEAIAGYLDINFNPFKSLHTLPDNEAAAATTVLDSPDNEKDILISAELLAKQMDANKTKSKDKKKAKSKKGSVSPKVTPKSTPKPSPRSSPRISPRSSPLLKLRKLKDDQLSASSVGIEIHIESPSEDGSVKSGLLSVK